MGRKFACGERKQVQAGWWCDALSNSLSDSISEIIGRVQEASKRKAGAAGGGTVVSLMQVCVCLRAPRGNGWGTRTLTPVSVLPDTHTHTCEVYP